MYDTILIPTDGSERAMYGVEEGLALAKELGSTVHILFVVHPDGLVGRVRAQFEAFGYHITDEIAALAASEGIEAVPVVIDQGTPHEEISAYAQENDIDAIVMGSKGRSNLETIFLGSTTRRVIGSVTIPVIVVGESSFDRISDLVERTQMPESMDEIEE